MLWVQWAALRLHLILGGCKHLETVIIRKTSIYGATRLKSMIPSLTSSLYVWSDDGLKTLQVTWGQSLYSNHVSTDCRPGMIQSLTSGTGSATAGLTLNPVRALLLDLYFSHRWEYAHLKDHNLILMGTKGISINCIVVFLTPWCTNLFCEDCPFLSFSPAKSWRLPRCLLLSTLHPLLLPIPSIAPWGFEFSSFFLFSRLMKGNPSAL